DARYLELAADDADVAAWRTACTHDRGQLVKDGCEEGRARVADARDDPLGTRVHQLEDVVGRLDGSPGAGHRRVVEHFGTASDVPHGGAMVVSGMMGPMASFLSDEWLDQLAAAAQDDEELQTATAG